MQLQKAEQKCVSGKAGATRAACADAVQLAVAALQKALVSVLFLQAVLQPCLSGTRSIMHASWHIPRHLKKNLTEPPLTPLH